MKDLQVYSKKIKQKDIEKKEVKSLFKGKYILKKRKGEEPPAEDDVKIGENHDWKETPVYKQYVLKLPE
jgi:hypothetical protein